MHGGRFGAKGEGVWGGVWVSALTYLRYSLICAVYFACVVAIET